jgi:hypothetical protein
MRAKIISLLALTTLASLGVLGIPQSKAQRYNARVIVQSTSNETYEFTRDVGKEHQLSKGTAHIETAYSQNFVIVVQGGIVTVAQSVGPASSSVSGTISTNQEVQETPLPKETFTETFSSNPHSENDADQGTGTSTGIVLHDFRVDGQGLAIRIDTKAQLKGKCVSSTPPGNVCMGDAFEHGGDSPSKNTNAHTDAAPMVMDFRQMFDFYGKPDPADPTMGKCDNCFLGGDVQGGLNSSYTFTGSAKKTSNPSGWKRSWETTVKAQIAILGKI